ncbi:E3 ubiquitin-protein ligase FANCL [Atta colombica]|uniref:E3 ubiquitin-protein ligase FANCL n=1 Tax=Atta colombica TaxID=520822 RepID=A0A195AUB4_9HYME|nr:PREDICTED: E3 ubiquitin-protein ligase FANCL [Atta colombica]KYM75574.1 E3 ubiquitin-protein ligase FANCL [Atta colombica]
MATKHNLNYNYEEILKCHPEMILISESPVTWQGFLLVSELYPTTNIRCSRVKVKLVMPNYPSFDKARISFGKHIAFLRNIGFSREVKKSMKTQQKTVSLFLSQLQLLIGKYIHNTSSKVCIPFDFESTTNFLHDIKAALQNQSDVQLSCDRNLSTIKLSLREIFLTLQRCKDIDIPWKVVSSNMPENFEKIVLSKNLNIMTTKFKWQVEILERAWEQLKEIDENCWVIDPPKPNKSHMHRRIHLSQSISITITIDPVAPTVVPTIQFSGSDNEVKRQMEDVSNNIHNWNPDYNILDNLRMLLNMYTFPEQQDNLDDSQGVISNRECGICFSETSETDELPNKICNNYKCMKYFHSVCLSKWLQTNATNQVVFSHIYGNCPHCKEDISCPIEC